jgi:hypothetical protein
MIELEILRISQTLMMPASAIIVNRNGMQVAVVENGVAHLHKIAIRTDYSTEVEINAGVKDGDQVILQPPENLTDGDKVQIIPGTFDARNPIQGNGSGRDCQAHPAAESAGSASFPERKHSVSR